MNHAADEEPQRTRDRGERCSEFVAHYRDEFIFDAYRFFTLLDLLKRLIMQLAVLSRAPGRIGYILYRKQRMKALPLGSRQARHGRVLNTGGAIPQRRGNDVRILIL